MMMMKKRQVEKLDEEAANEAEEGAALQVGTCAQRSYALRKARVSTPALLRICRAHTCAA